ncbi:M23 family metallopeptidase [Thermoleophilia bacterium SCSIO 60948]|nr:M23 family metallopeptidase [Thermoleophilia bacterium SCSIO 60948]
MGLGTVLTLGAVPVFAIADGGGGVGTGGGSGGVSGKNSFPVKGKHEWGQGFGAGRGHQGQDLLAGCRQPVVAATPGRVRLVDRQASAAGNYVVIRRRGSKLDAVYMHLKKRASVREGERVDAGEQIGVVGDTGNATACLLHYESWTEPGWYSGGRAKDPRRQLRRLDGRHGG